MNDEVMRFMIQKTVEEHLKKEREVQSQRNKSVDVIFH
jgi:hypothetical protein